MDKLQQTYNNMVQELHVFASNPLNVGSQRQTVDSARLSLDPDLLFFSYIQPLIYPYAETGISPFLTLSNYGSSSIILY